jgi:hypothetical protein
MLTVFTAVTYPAECTQEQFFQYLETIANAEPLNSREDTNTAQSQIGRWEEASMASLRQAMVCWMHHTHNRKLDQSRHK